MSLGICLGTTLPGNDRNSGKGRNMAALPSLYWFPVGRFRHIGAIRAGSEKLKKMVKKLLLLDQDLLVLHVLVN